MSAGQTNSFASVIEHDNNADNCGLLKNCRVESVDAHPRILLETVNTIYMQLRCLQVPKTKKPRNKIPGLLLSSVEKSI